MIRPVCFSFNEQTAKDNHYQKKDSILGFEEIQQKALAEFETFVEVLSEHQIVLQIETDTPSPITPDSIFPNNWISFHQNKLVLYPMYAKNRRLERRRDIVTHFQKKNKQTEIIDLSAYEQQDKFLEGTGSMVLDRENKIAYASLSQRTHPEVLMEFCRQLNYRPLAFRSMQKVNEGYAPIYHTNVMMCLTEKNALVCLEVIKDIHERKRLIESIESCGKNLIEITEQQVNQFAGNMLQVKNLLDQRFLIMSTQAFESLSVDQKTILEKENTLLHSPLNTIEKHGGGSARCMLCEVF